MLILTARDGWTEKVDGFKAGADDYLTKPFRVEELIMRLRALVRRSAGHAAPEVACGPLTFDAPTGRVRNAMDLPLKLDGAGMAGAAIADHAQGGQPSTGSN